MRIGSNSDFGLRIVPDALGKAPYGCDFDSYRKARSLGVEMMLIWCYGNVVFGTDPPDFRELDYEVGAALMCGIEPVIKVMYAPESVGDGLWSREGLPNQVAPFPSFPSAWLTDALTTLALRYPGVKYFCAWNEPNPGYGNWPSENWQQLVDQVYGPASAALQAVRPGDAILCGPCSDDVGNLDAILAIEQGNCFGRRTNHTYPWARENFLEDAIARMKQFKAVLDARQPVPHVTIPSWLTECAPSNKFCADGPGSDMLGLFDAAAGMGYDAAFSYRIRSETEGRVGEPGIPTNDGWGLFMLGLNWSTINLDRAQAPFKARQEAISAKRVRSINR